MRAAQSRGNHIGPPSRTRREASFRPPKNVAVAGCVGLLHLLGNAADTIDMRAFITVADAAGRVLFRRPATESEVMSAIAAAETAEIEVRAALERIERERIESQRAEPHQA
jgi:hypothetical protein